MCRRTIEASRTMSKPATLARPELGGSNVVSILTSVLLPAPFDPIRPKISPRLTAIDTSATAARSPKLRVSLSVTISYAVFCLKKKNMIYYSGQPLAICQSLGSLPPPIRIVERFVVHGQSSTPPKPNRIVKQCGVLSQSPVSALDRDQGTAPGKRLSF